MVVEKFLLPDTDVDGDAPAPLDEFWVAAAVVPAGAGALGEESVVAWLDTNLSPMPASAAAGLGECGRARES